MTLTRIGFAGAGGIAGRHLDVLRQFPDAVIAAVTDKDPDRAAAFARASGARTYASHQDMMRDAGLDALYVCVPPFAHGEIERAAIAARVPFFVEKPLSADLAVAETIAAEVEAGGLVTAVGYHWRYLDTVEEARRLLADNPPHLMSGHWFDQTPPPRWWWREDGSGGQIVEQATHIIDLARFLAGDVTEVYAAGARRDRADFPGLDVATASAATLRFASGAIATLGATCVLRWGHRIGLHVYADALAIELSDHDIMVDVGRGRPVRGANGDPVWREDRDFVDAVRGEPNLIRTSYAEALKTHRVALAAVRSAATGAPVSLDGFADPRPVSVGPLRPVPSPPDRRRVIRSLGIEREGVPYYFEYHEEPPGEGQVRLDLVATGFSAGTELTFLKNTNPYLHARWDQDMSAFVPGEPSARYPVPFLGYMEVGRVVESRSPGFQPGDIVATTFAHKSGHVADPRREMLIRLPPGLDPVLGVLVAQMGPIAANGILHADAEVFGAHSPGLGAGVAGRPVLVWGGGTVGMLTALFARQAGAAEILIAEPSPFRRAIAAKLGFLALGEDAAWRHAKAMWRTDAGGNGAEFVFQTRARSESLGLALRALRSQGTVIDLAFYQGGMSGLRLGEDFHHNGLSIRCAQINRAPRVLAASWDRRRLALETIRLLEAEGAGIRAHMFTHLVPFEDGAAFLKNLVTERPDFMQIVFEGRA